MVSRQLPTQQLGLAGQPAYCLLETLQRLQLAAQPAILPVQPTGLPVQGTDFPAQRLDRVLLLPRPFQRLAQPGARPGRRSLRRSFRPAKRRDLPAQRHELVLLLLRALQRLSQPGVLSRQRPDRVLAGLRRRRGLGRLVLLSRRRGRRILPGLRRLQGFAQPEDFHAQRHDRAALARLDAGLRKELLQPRHFRLVEQRVLRRAADFLRLLDGRLAVLKKRADKVELGLPQLCRDVGGGGSPCFELPVYPRHEQHVTQSRLNRGGSGKQGFGKRVAQAAEAHLVDGPLLFEEIQDLPHPVPVACRQIEPGQRRVHASLSRNFKLKCG